jgi:hypothetical protein
MKSFLASNLETRGRIIRGIVAVILLAGALASLFLLPPVSPVLLIAGLFILFEALRGWCVLRACGIKTRL